MERLRLKSWLMLQSPPTRTELLVRVAMRAPRVSRGFSASRQADFAARAAVTLRERFANNR